MKLRFSDRIEKTKPSEVVQIDNMNDTLRYSLWNWIFIQFYTSYEITTIQQTTKFLCVKYYREPLDKLPNRTDDYVTWLRNKFMAAEWYEVYNLIEYFFENGKQMKSGFLQDKFKNSINQILAEENAGYRFIGNELVPITNETEIESISDAIMISQQSKLFGATTHFEAALKFISLKPEPEFRNSIKESISAVESVVKQLSGEKAGGLDKALNLLDDKIKFHQAFKQGLSKLYGYTSDEKGGIRHAILEEKEIGFDEAKFMLVSCSALVNFLIAKAEKAGLLTTNKKV